MSRHNIPTSNAYKLCLALTVQRDLVSFQITYKSTQVKLHLRNSHL